MATATIQIEERRLAFPHEQKCSACEAQAMPQSECCSLHTRFHIAGRVTAAKLMAIRIVNGKAVAR